MKTKYILFMCLYVGFYFNSFASVITVQNTNDSGVGSLRQAIDSASSADIIRFNPNLLISGGNTINLSSKVTITDKALTIIGLYNNSDTLYINGNDSTQIFNVNLASAPATQKYLVLDSLVLINGNANGSANGGAISIKDADSLIVTNCILSGNTAVNGGGIFSSMTADLILINSSLNDNSATDKGGGIHSYSYYPIIIKAIGSTFSENNAPRGGGIYSETFNSSKLKIKTSSFIDNNASSSGGSIFSSGSSNSQVTLTSSSLINNTAINGGGIFSVGANSNILITGSILSNDTNNINNNGNYSFTSGGYNIFSDSPNGLNTTNDQRNITSTQLNLQPLAYNGGATKTMLPGAGSVAINAGDPSDLSDAQNRPIVGTRDVGAAEYNCTASYTENEIATNIFTWKDGKTYTADTSGITHTVYSSDTLICDSIITLNLTINTVGLTEFKKNNINIYPNPTNNLLNINTSNSTILTVSILDVTGKSVKLIKGNFKTIYVSELTNGIYFLQLDTENGLITSKFIKN